MGKIALILAVIALTCHHNFVSGGVFGEYGGPYDAYGGGGAYGSPYGGFGGFGGYEGGYAKVHHHQTPFGYDYGIKEHGPGYHSYSYNNAAFGPPIPYGGFAGGPFGGFGYKR